MLFCGTFSHVPGNGKVLATNSTMLLRREKLYKNNIFIILLYYTQTGEGNGTPLQYSCLENPMDRGAWKAAVHGVAEGQTRLHFHFSLSCIGEGNGNPLRCSRLENPRDRGAWWAAIYGVAWSQTQLKWLSSSKDPSGFKLWSLNMRKLTIISSLAESQILLLNKAYLFNVRLSK